MFPADRIPIPVAIEYEGKKGRNIRQFPDMYSARRFYVQMDSQSKHPKVLSLTSLSKTESRIPPVEDTLGAITMSSENTTVTKTTPVEVKTEKKSVKKSSPKKVAKKSTKTATKKVVKKSAKVATKKTVKKSEGERITYQMRRDRILKGLLDSKVAINRAALISYVKSENGIRTVCKKLAEEGLVKIVSLKEHDPDGIGSGFVYSLTAKGKTTAAKIK